MAEPPAPAGTPASDSVSFRKFVGMKNTVEPERLGPDELAEATNVDLDDVGMLHRRQGRRLVSAGNWGGLYTSWEGQVYGVLNNSLGRVNPNYTFTAFQSGFDPTKPIAYVQIDKNIYFSSKAQSVSGIIRIDQQDIVPWQGPALGPPYIPDPLDPNAPPIPALQAGTWWYSPVVNPVATLPPIRGKILGPPPFASIIDYYNGRIYMAVGRVVWHSELFNYNYVDKTKGFLQFENDVTMIGVVTDGVYIGTSEGLWFISPTTRIEGHPAGAFKRVRVMDSAVIPGSMVYIPGELANPSQVGLNEDTPRSVSIMFMTVNGYCVGKDSGQAINFSEDKFVFPKASQASAMYRFQKGIHQYVATLNSEGTPMSGGAVFGDYLDATVIKAGSWQTLKDGLRIGDELSGTVIPG
jgi:hypothetical protein